MITATFCVTGENGGKIRHCNRYYGDREIERERERERKIERERTRERERERENEREAQRDREADRKGRYIEGRRHA